MSDIRKRVGSKGTTYQVRYPSKKTKSGYAFSTFNTLKEARAFRENAALRAQQIHSSGLKTSVAEGVQKWLDVCEKEGRGGRNPVTPYTLKTYKYRAGIITSYEWPKPLEDLSAPDVVEFRSWLLKHYSRDQARKVLSYFHSMVLELVNRGVIQHDFAAGVKVSSVSRYDQPVRIPSEAEVYELLAAADRLANSKNGQIAKTWTRYRPMLYLAADSGMRPQEYLVVSRSNLTDKGIMVDRALDAGGAEISVTKTRAGRRFIDLSPSTIEMLRHYSDEIAVENKYDLIFPTANGRWQSSNNWRRRGFQTACIEAGLLETVEVGGSPRTLAYERNRLSFPFLPA